MTIANLLSALFNLGAQTNFWNSNSAARDFWLIFAAGVVAAVVYFTVRTLRDHRIRRGHEFGHSFHNHSHGLQ
jgi:hypothetical protein